ncbi:unnamed protein product [Rhodiola kirilowii]
MQGRHLERRQLFTLRLYIDQTPHATFAFPDKGCCHISLNHPLLQSARRREAY